MHGEHIFGGGVTLITDAEELTYGNLTYVSIDEDSDGTYDYIEITDCDIEVTEVEIPAKIDGLAVESIGREAFLFCSRLEGVIIPNGVINIGNNAFEGCSNLAEVVIPNGVTSIGNSTFERCKNLIEITIPDSVTSIGSAAFYNCTSLESISIPKNVTSIGEESFCRCENLTSITFDNPECEIVDSYNGDYDELTISDTTTIYGYEGSTAQAYAENYGLSFVSLGEYVETITGDVTGDSAINLYDAIEIARYIMDARDFTDEEKEIADYNGDDEVNLYDVIEIAKYMMS